MEGILLYRADLIEIANKCRATRGEYVGMTDPSHLGYTFETLFLCANNYWLKRRFPILTARWQNLLQKEKAKKFMESSMNLKEREKLNLKLIKGKIKWFEAAPLEEGVHEKNSIFLNIGKYFVTAGACYNSNNRGRSQRLITGRRDKEESLFIKSDHYPLPHFDPNGYEVTEHNFCDELSMIPELTLVDQIGFKPNFEATRRWHEEDADFVQTLASKLQVWSSYFNRPSGPYISEDWRFIEKMDVLFRDLPSREYAITQITAHFAEIGAPECSCTSAGWVPVRTNDDQPNYSPNGDYLGQKASPEVYRWGLRLGFSMNKKPWGGEVVVWASYRPDIDIKRPWRVIKSTICQRKNNWSKNDSSITGQTYYNQILPDIEHAIPEWATVFMAQGCEQYPALYEPQFNGSNSKGKLFSAMKNLKNKIKKSTLVF